MFKPAIEIDPSAFRMNIAATPTLPPVATIPSSNMQCKAREKELARQLTERLISELKEELINASIGESIQIHIPPIENNFGCLTKVKFIGRANASRSDLTNLPDLKKFEDEVMLPDVCLARSGTVIPEWKSIKFLIGNEKYAIVMMCFVGIKRAA